MGQQLPKFYSEMRNDKLSVCSEFEPGARALLVACGGFHGHLGIKNFEFYNLTAMLGVNRLYLRDQQRCYYQRGLEGVGDSVDDVIEMIRRLQREHDIERTVIIGNSIGGYASILFGVSVDADVVLSFSPKSCLHLGKRLRMRDVDLRYFGILKRIRQGGRKGPLQNLDLAELLPQLSYSTDIHVHYCQADRIDRAHAENLAGLPGVTLHSEGGDGHKMIKSLRDSGWLGARIREALSLPAESPATESKG